MVCEVLESQPEWFLLGVDGERVEVGHQWPLKPMSDQAVMRLAANTDDQMRGLAPSYSCEHFRPEFACHAMSTRYGVEVKALGGAASTAAEADLGASSYASGCEHRRPDAWPCSF